MLNKINTINTIKCPHCHRRNTTLISGTLYHCHHCGDNFYLDEEKPSTVIVQTRKNRRVFGTAGWFFLAGLFVICAALLTFYPKLIEQASSILASQQAESASHTAETSISQPREDVPFVQAKPVEQPDHLTAPQAPTSPSRPETIATDVAASPPQPRLVYLFYADNGRYRLFKANYLTTNQAPGEQAILIQKSRQQLVAYDSLTHKKINNFKELTANNHYIAPEILFSDGYVLLIRSQISQQASSGYQLQKVNTINGHIEWQLPEQRLIGPTDYQGRIQVEKGDIILNLQGQIFKIDKEGKLSQQLSPL